MTADALRQFTTPREGELGLRQISNKAGLAASLLPNGALFVLRPGYAPATPLK